MYACTHHFTSIDFTIMTNSTKEAAIAMLYDEGMQTVRLWFLI